jgi:cell division protein FtsA
VKELDIEVLDVVFNPLAAAKVVLDQNQKNLGALVVDMGGGTTDYIVCVDGAVKASGCIAVGGDHITNDLSLGLRIPMARAEKLKIEEGSVVLGQSSPGEMVKLHDETGFVGKEIEREMLNTIIHMRVRETFELLVQNLEPYGFLPYLGAGLFLTGGCSLIPGIADLASEIFGLPVQVTRAQAVSGPASAFENPQLSTGIGIIKFAQAMQPERPRGVLSRIARKLKFFAVLVVTAVIAALVFFLRNQ